jgi:hypothetical protein
MLLHPRGNHFFRQRSCYHATLCTVYREEVIPIGINPGEIRPSSAKGGPHPQTHYDGEHDHIPAQTLVYRIHKKFNNNTSRIVIGFSPYHLDVILPE